MNIAIPIFDRLTALDAVGPYEVLSRLPGATVHFVAAEPGPKRTENSMLALVADRRPGGAARPGDRGRARRLRHQGADAGRGDAVLAAPCARELPMDDLGLHRLAAARRRRHPRRARGDNATGSPLDALERYGATPVSRRVVEQGKVITAAGVSSGIDMALTLAAHIAGDDAGAGDPARHRVRPAAAVSTAVPRATATPEVVALVRENAGQLA